MADEYYTLPTGFLDSLDKRRRQRSLGGQSYDPREMVDATKGAFEAAIARNQTRQKLADDKKYREDVLADTKQGRADTIAANAALQAERLAQNDKQFNITTQNTQDWRQQELDERKSAREDAETGSMINALLKGASLVANDFLRGEAEGKGNKEPSLMNRASNYFKQLGGETSGEISGDSTGAYYVAAPGNYNEMPVEMAPPTALTPSSVIGQDAEGGNTSTREIMSKAYGDSQESAKPIGKTMTAAADTDRMTDAGGTLPAIGQPIDQQSFAGGSGKPAYENTDLATTNAAEPNTGGAGAAAAGEGANEPMQFGRFADYVPPELPAFQAPTLTPYAPPTLEPFSYVPSSGFTEHDYYQWMTARGEAPYGKDWKEEKYLPWVQNRKGEDIARQTTEYNTWAAAQNAAAKSAYDSWATQQTEKAKQDYDQWVKSENTKAENAYEAAKAKYGRDVANYEAPGADTGKGSWAYNEKRLGGPMEAEAEYYGGDFSRAVPMSPTGRHEFESLGVTPTGAASGDYYPAPPAPMRAESEARAPFPTGEFTAKPAEYYQSDSGAVSWESPYNYSRSYSAIAPTPVYENYNYEPPPSYGGSGYEPPSYEPGIYGGTDDFDEPVNYEPGPYGGGGKIVCTELNRQGYLSDELLRKDSQCRQEHIPFDVYTGYLTLFSPVVALMRRSKVFTNIVRPFALATAKEMASRVDPTRKGTLLGKLLLKAGIPLCKAVGHVVLGAVQVAVQNTEVQHG